MKHKKMIIAALFALTMTACGDTGNAEEITLSEYFTSEAVHAEESVLTTESETDTEAENTTTAEITTTEETTTAAEVVTEVDSEGNTIFKMTADTKFYECELTDENSVTSAEEFADKELFDKAVTVLEESDFYADIYEQLCTAAEEQGYTDMSECKPVCKLVNAITADFNGDGKKETAFFVSVNNASEVPVYPNEGMTNFLLIADGSGKIYIADNKFSDNAKMRELKYNGFSHLVVSGGGLVGTHQVCIYSVQESGLKAEYIQGASEINNDLYGSFALRISVYSAPGIPDYIILWNDDLKCYVTPQVKYITGEEAEQIKSHMDISDDEKKRYTEFIISVIGNKYYSIHQGSEVNALTYGITYEYKDGEYLRLKEEDGHINVISRIADDGVNDFNIIWLDDFDFETAEKNLVKID